MVEILDQSKEEESIVLILVLAGLLTSVVEKNSTSKLIIVCGVFFFLGVFIMYVEKAKTKPLPQPRTQPTLPYSPSPRLGGGNEMVVLVVGRRFHDIAYVFVLFYWVFCFYYVMCVCMYGSGSFFLYL